MKLFFCQVRFQLYLKFHLQILALIYQKDVFHINNFQYLAKCSSISHVLLHSQSHVLGFHIYSFIQETQLFDSSQSHRHLSLFHFCNELHTLWFNPHLHSHYSCWTKCFVSFTLVIKLHTFRFFFYFIWNANSSIGIINSVTASTALIDTNSLGTDT